MTVKVKDWTAALRSGNYTQGRYRLRSGTENPEYCCLGVLCDLIDPNGWSNDDLKYDLLPGEYVWLAPEELIKQRSYNTSSLYRVPGALLVQNKIDQIELSFLNDGNRFIDPDVKKPATFNDIADFIDKKYDGDMELV